MQPAQLTAVVLSSLALLNISEGALAVPSFTRQLGVECKICHVSSFGPDLTPFGRDFKIHGYLWSKPASSVPISGMVMESFTRTNRDQEKESLPKGIGLQKNNNFTLDQASVFYAGPIRQNMGAFSQLTFDGVENKWGLDNTDLRLVSQGSIAGQDITYGISLNNLPMVQDPWNTGAVWGFPFHSSPIAPGPGATTLIDGGFGASQVGGESVYGMINGIVYVEAGAYQSMPNKLQGNFGVWDKDQNKIDGSSPYWRLAWQRSWDGQYIAIGHYGLSSRLYPAGERNNGTDSYNDTAFDVSYQYLGDLVHIFEVRSSYIQEQQVLSASKAAGLSSSSAERLHTFKIDAAYTLNQSYGLTIGYNATTGTSNPAIYSTDRDFSASGSPDSEYSVVDFSYVPTLPKLGSLEWLELSLHLGASYVAYSKFNGIRTHASDLNALLLNTWLAF